MKRFPAALAALILVLALLAAWFLAAAGPRGPRVNPSKIPPPIVISLTQSNGPLRVFPGLGTVLFILPDGRLWIWGRKQPVGRGTASIPQQISSNPVWSQAVVSNNHFLFLQTNGSLWQWGWFGTSPSGASAFSSVPAQLGADHDWVDIAAGDLHSVALKRDGTLWAWGDNSDHQLGAFKGSSSLAPVRIGSKPNWTAIACRQGLCSLALDDHGRLWAWGSLPLISQTNEFVAADPVQVCRETNWAALESCGLAFAINRDAELWLPDRAPPDANAAAASSCRLAATNWIFGRSAFAYCGAMYRFQIHPDGTLWKNAYDHSWRPAKKWRRVGDRSDWVGLWGHGTTLGLTADGTVWTWGVDPSQPSVPNLPSRLEHLKAAVQGWFGHPPSVVTTSGAYPYQDQPRPLFVMHDG